MNLDLDELMLAALLDVAANTASEMNRNLADCCMMDGLSLFLDDVSWKMTNDQLTISTHRNGQFTYFYIQGTPYNNDRGPRGRKYSSRTKMAPDWLALLLFLHLPRICLVFD